MDSFLWRHSRQSTRLGKGHLPQADPDLISQLDGPFWAAGSYRGREPLCSEISGDVYEPRPSGFPIAGQAHGGGGGGPARVRGRYQADSGVVTGARQEVGQQLGRGALLQLPLPGVLPGELQRVQTALHEAEPEVPQSSHQRAADIL